MSGIVISLEQLRGMIGLRVRHEGMFCEVIEVLEDGPSLVLVNIGEDAIQADQFGNPKRRVPENFVIPVLTPDGEKIHPAYLALDLLDE